MASSTSLVTARSACATGEVVAVSSLFVSISDADLYDIAPTILDLMDHDYDRTEFDGSSLV